MEDLEEGLDDFDTTATTSGGGGVSDLEVDEVAMPVEPVASLPSWVQRNKRPMLIGGMVVALVFFLSITGLLLVLFGGKAPTPMPYPVWNSYRLPEFVKPSMYSMNLTLDVEAGVLLGSQTIRISVTRNTSFIVLHAAPSLQITRALLKLAPEPTRSPTSAWMDKRSSDSEVFLAAHTIYDAEHQQYRIQWQALQDYTSPGSGSTETDFLVGLEWRAVISDSMEGLYRSTYKEPGGQSVVMAATQFEATDARMMFPCFDEPAMKAIFVITVNAHKSRRTVLSNMPVAEQAEVGDMLRTTFAATPRMSTYLVALVVSSLQSSAALTPAPHIIPVKVWARPEVASQGQYAADISAAILSAFGTYFEIDYLLPKMDLAAIPDFSAGAMENWGLMTFRETALLWDAANSGTLAKQRVATVVAHELAHQWFGDTVTMAWWEDIWLNEGFATFVEYLGVDRVSPQWRIWDHFVVEDLQRALLADSLGSTHPIQAPGAETPEQIGGLFGAIIYSKGGSVLRMLEAHLEAHKPDSFRSGLAIYLKKHKLGNAATADLWRALSQSSGIDVGEMMPSWTMRQGYPLVTVTTDASGTVSFEQERFLIHPTNPTTPVAEYYHIPIQFSYENGGSLENGTVVLKEERVSAPFMCKGRRRHCTDKLLIVNRDRRGFYRVRYSPAQLDKIVAAVAAGSSLLTGADVVGTLDDLWQMSFSLRDYQVDMARVLALAKAAALQYHTSVVVTKAVNTLLEAGQHIGGSAEADAMRLVAAGLPQVDPDASSTHDGKLLHTFVRYAGVVVNHTTMVAQSLADFAAFKTSRALDPDLRASAYRAAVSRERNAAQLAVNFDWLLQYYQSTGSTAADRTSALYALCSTTDNALFSRLLTLSLDKTQVRAQDTASVLIVAARNNREAVWNFMELKYDELKARYATELFTFGEMVSVVASGFRTTTALERVNVFLTGKQYDATKKAGILDQIAANAAWNAKSAMVVTQWFQEQTANLPSK